MTYNPNEWREITLEEVPTIHDSIEGIVEGWFLDSPLNAEDFLARLEGDLLPDGKKLDLGTQMDSPVVLAVLKYARRVKKESTS